MFNGYETAARGKPIYTSLTTVPPTIMVFDVSFESAFRQAGFKAEVIPNQGRGAAKMRIEAARRLFPSVWFNKETTEAGRDALGLVSREEKRRCERCRAGAGA